jgi:hypothetical protein
MHHNQLANLEKKSTDASMRTEALARESWRPFERIIYFRLYVQCYVIMLNVIIMRMKQEGLIQVKPTLDHTKWRSRSKLKAYFP